MDVMQIVWWLVIGGIGFLLGWLLKPSKKQAGDLSKEGEGALRAEVDTLRARVQDLEGRLASRDKDVSDLTTKLAAAESDAPDASAGTSATAKTSDDDETYALEWQNRYLAARVKYLESRIADGGGDAVASAPAKKTAKKSTSQKSASKKPAAKKAAAKTKSAGTKSAATRSTTKKAPAKKTTAATATAAPAKKSTAKKPSAKKAPAAKAAAKPKANPKLNRAFDQLKKFDAKANRSVFESIYKYCGVAMTTRDGSLVACRDEAELETVANGFVTKKLGVESGQLDLVKGVCEQMKAQRLKNRAVFYYLAAKKAKKLSVFK